MIRKIDFKLLIMSMLIQRDYYCLKTVIALNELNSYKFIAKVYTSSKMT